MNVDTMMPDGRSSPFALAAQHGHIGLMRKLAERGANVEWGRPHDSAMCQAATFGRLDIMKMLHGEFGAEFRAKGYTLQGPIHTAAEFDRVDVVQWLIEMGEDVNCKNPSGRAPLHCAALSADITGMLLDAGARVTEEDEDGKTPLHVAAAGLNVTVVRLLIKSGASVDASDNRGFTPLHCVVVPGFEWGTMMESLQIIKVLVNMGASVHVREDDNRMDSETRRMLKSRIAEWMAKANLPIPPSTPSPTAEGKRTCGQCGTKAQKMKSCRGCSKEYYCNEEHQRLHWKTHKPHCVKK